MKALKRAVAIAMTAATGVWALCSCSMAGDGTTGDLSEYFAGEMLSVSVSVPGSGNSGENIVNGMGMSGMYAPNQLHSNNGEHMFLSETGEKDIAFVFETEKTEPIGRVYIWNYCAAKDLSAGLKKVTAAYSLDGENYTDLGVYEIEKGDPSGEESYSGMIDFGGVAAKYIRLTPDGAEGNYGDADGRYGLAEVRVYRFKTHPQKQGAVVVSSFEEDGENPSFGGENLTNNRGMSGALSAGDKHSNDPADMGYIDMSTGADSFVFYLDGTYPIDSMYIWNYNDPDNLDAGLKNVRISYSVDGEFYLELKDSEGNRDFTLTQASGDDGIGYTDRIKLGGINAGFIKITVQREDGTYGNAARAGLSEVRFTVAKGWAVEPARDWTGLFSRQSGWLAADGIFTVNMNGYDVQGSSDEDSKTLFVFSDTAIGTVDYTDMRVNQTGFVNHSFAYLEGNEPDPKKIEFVLEKPTVGGNILGDSLWLTDAVRVSDKTVYVGAVKFNSSWGADRMDMASFRISSKTGFLNIASPSRTQGVAMQYKNGNSEVLMGCGIMNNSKETGNPKGDGYIYIYGYRNTGSGKKNLVAARTLPENFGDVSGWEYYTGEGWEKGIASADTKEAHLCKEDISSELSVTPITSGMFKGKYMLVYTASTMSPNVRFALGDSPVGPFEDITMMYYCPEMDELHSQGDPGAYTYNCKAHPNLSKPGELLISYNLNSTTNFSENTYRYYPQFIKMYEIK